MNSISQRMREQIKLPSAAGGAFAHTGTHKHSHQMSRHPQKNMQTLAYVYGNNHMGTHRCSPVCIRTLRHSYSYTMHTSVSNFGSEVMTRIKDIGDYL